MTDLNLPTSFTFDATERRAIERAIASPSPAGLIQHLEACVLHLQRDLAFENMAAVDDDGYFAGRDGWRRELKQVQAAGVELVAALVAASEYTREQIADCGHWGGAFVEWERRLAQLYQITEDLLARKATPGPRTGTPRHYFEHDVAGVLRRHGIKVTGYDRGPYVRVLAIALRAATGEQLPKDPRPILKRVMTAANGRRRAAATKAAASGWDPGDPRLLLRDKGRAR